MNRQSRRYGETDDKVVAASGIQEQMTKLEAECGALAESLLCLSQQLEAILQTVEEKSN